MKKLIKIMKKENGQSLVLVALLMVVILGFAALAIDVGMMSVAKDDLQISADSAALAGAQELPYHPDQAKTVAQNYVTSNGLSNDKTTITIGENNKSITVKVTRAENMSFARVLGVNAITGSAIATASIGVAASVPWIVPFVIAKPEAFYYDKVYVMRMYGAGDFLDYPKTNKNKTGYPSDYSYPSDYQNDQVYKNYSISNPYPYQFDYMNVYIETSSGFSNYIEWLKNGYHETFKINQDMYYYAPSSGGTPSVDAFADRVTRDSNTDYTKAKLGDGRVMLIPVVEKMLKRDTSTNGTVPIKIIGFVGFFIKSVHKNSYEESFWFEGRFLKDFNIGSGEVSYDPNADFGLRVQKLTK
jgi:Flp pilus assembly protein TadG